MVTFTPACSRGRKTQARAKAASAPAQLQPTLPDLCPLEQPVPLLTGMKGWDLFVGTARKMGQVNSPGGWAGLFITKESVLKFTTVKNQNSLVSKQTILGAAGFHLHCQVWGHSSMVWGLPSTLEPGFSPQCCKKVYCSARARAAWQPEPSGHRLPNSETPSGLKRECQPRRPFLKKPLRG